MPLNDAEITATRRYPGQLVCYHISMEYPPDNSNHEPLLNMLDVELSDELVEVISAIKAALQDENTDQSTLTQLWTEYSLRFEALAEQTSGSYVYTKVQLGAILHKALIFRDTQNQSRYLEELDFADIYAASYGFDELNSFISAEIDRQIHNPEQDGEHLILQLRNKMSDSRRILLWDAWRKNPNYESLLRDIADILLEEGENPKEIFAELGIIQP